MANLITKHIPNTLTSLNLISGCVAIMSAYNGDFKQASLFIIIGAIFDFFDGMSARLLNVSSPIGKELDSLADCVTFGVAPSMMVFTLLSQLLSEQYPTLPMWIINYLPYIAFVMAAFSALRLAKFNLDERQTTDFIGLNTPANSMFWIGVAAAVTSELPLISNPWVIIGLMLVFSFMLISEIPFFSFKFKSLSWANNKLRYIFLILAIILLATLHVAGLAAVILLYIIMSLLFYKK